MLLPDPETCRRLARDVAPRWVFFPGMQFLLANSRYRVDARTGRTATYYLAAMGYTRVVPANALPDITDPLTAAGALLVARAAWGDPDLCPVHLWVTASDPASPPDYWLVSVSRGRDFGARDFTAATELEALVAAILAAPEK